MRQVEKALDDQSNGSGDPANAEQDSKVIRSAFAGSPNKIEDDAVVDGSTFRTKHNRGNLYPRISRKLGRTWPDVGASLPWIPSISPSLFT